MAAVACNGEGEGDVGVAPQSPITECRGLDALPLCVDTLASSFEVGNIAHPEADSDAYAAPDAAAERLIADSVDALVDNDAATARANVELPNAGNLDFILCKDPDAPVARWEPR
ncbi:MAG: hypothetical protein AAB131_10595, partial [Actinomycetota bacterium]